MSSANQQALERRADWLQEDLEVVKRRAADTFASGSTSQDAMSKSEGMSRLQGVANQLLGELSEEREWREHLEAELTTIETTLLQERSNREKALGLLSRELEETMKSLVQRIDNGLAASTGELSSRAAKTEAALKGLITRVDEGLASGARDLEETLATGSCTPVGNANRGGGGGSFTAPISYPSLAPAAGALSGLRPSALPPDFAKSVMANLPRVPESKNTAPPTPSCATPINIQSQGRPSMPANLDDSRRGSLQPNLEDSVTSSSTGYTDMLVNRWSKPSGGTEIASGGQSEAAEPLLKVWSELQEENMRLRQKRVQLEARQIRSRIGSRSPTGASASKTATPPGANSRNRSPKRDERNLGTGFRWRGQEPKQGSPSNMSNMTASPTVSMGNQNIAALLSGNLKGEPSLKDSDAVSTASSSLPTASVHNQSLQNEIANMIPRSSGQPIGSGDQLANSMQSLGSKTQMPQNVTQGGSITSAPGPTRLMQASLASTAPRRGSPLPATAAARQLQGSMTAPSGQLGSGQLYPMPGGPAVMGAPSGQNTPMLTRPGGAAGASAQIRPNGRVAQATSAIEELLRQPNGRVAQAGLTTAAATTGATPAAPPRSNSELTPVDRFLGPVMGQPAMSQPVRRSVPV